MESIFSNLYPVPRNLITEEIEGIYGSSVLQEMGEIIGYYDVYENGADFDVEGTGGDYAGAQLHYQLARNLIDKQARFLFSKSPDITIELTDAKGGDGQTTAQSTLQSFVDSVLEKNSFKANLLKASRDCFIGKRIAIVVNFNASGIQVSFIPSLEFIYDVDPYDNSKITKFIAFYTTQDDKQRQNQRIYKKKYWIENGACWFNETIYDGTGAPVETLTENTNTGLSEIPVAIVLNDGLTGDLSGRSEIKQLAGYESYYSKLANGDIDAERKSMNATRYTVNMSEASTRNLSTAPGSFWDLQQSPEIENASPQVGLLEPSMSYSSVLSFTLNRIKTTMYELVDVPDITADNMRGIMTSGKTIRALYYPLIVRCDEKMLAWKPAIEKTVRTIIEGAKVYTESAKIYTDNVPDDEYTVTAVNQYPLPEEESEEKQLDIAEVGNELMSKRAYMVKWRGLTPEQAEDELKQIAKERQVLEDSYTGTEI